MMRFLLFVWILSLPFYQFSIIGSFSVDNMLAPFLFLVWLAQVSLGRQSVTALQANNIIKTFILAGFYFVAHIIGLIGTHDAIWQSAYSSATNMLYFILPVLFIRTAQDLKAFKDAIIIIAIIASISGLLSALGVLELAFARQAESRIGVESLQKSIGVFSSYGDVAILLSLALLIVIADRKERSFIALFPYLKIIMMIVICVISIASMQSRNIVLTIMTALLSYWVIGQLIKKSKIWDHILYGGIILVVILSATVITLFSTQLLEIIQGIGGTKEAAGTVDSRLMQYRFMWDLVKDDILVGTDPNIHEKYINEINLTHNMWLKELVQGGIITVFAMLIILWRAIMVQVVNYKQGQVPKDSLVLISCLLGMIVATQFYPGGTYLFWCILGACSAMPFERDTKVIEPQIIKNNLLRVAR